MQADAARELVRQIHDAGTQLVLAVTGGGSGAIAALLETPGASRSVLEAVVPYSAAALTDWLGAKPEQFCSDRTTRAMAMAAYVRGQGLGADAAKLAGIGCTASLASDRPKHGDHRIHVAWQTQRATASASLVLEKGRRSRAAEERLAADIVLNMTADACGLTPVQEPPPPHPRPLSREGRGEHSERLLAARLPLELCDREQIKTARCDASPAWQALWSGRVDRAGQGPGAAARTQAVFSGAFNPLHVGHRRMSEVASDLVGSPVAFELSVFNVDKPPLDYLEVSQRLTQFAADQTVWLSRAPTFAEKADLFPGATFVVGADTIARIAEARYYGGSIAARDAAIEHIAACGCKFLVFGRATTGAFETLPQLVLPDRLLALCQEVSAEKFREDISSTKLRGSRPDGCG